MELSCFIGSRQGGRQLFCVFCTVLILHFVNDKLYWKSLGCVVLWFCYRLHPSFLMSPEAMQLPVQGLHAQCLLQSYLHALSKRCCHW
jgi:hypothetical protein